MPTHTSFKSVENIGDSLLTDILQTSTYSFLQWALLGIGNFLNVTIPQSGAYGGQEHRLRLSENPNYTQGQVWCGFRKDWVWETDIDYAVQPIEVSGVFVNGDFYPQDTTGVYSHYVDFPNGQVVFDSPIPTGSLVTCEYSYRLYGVTTADCPWWRKLQADSFRVDSSHFLQFGSGDWSTNPETRVQLPSVVVQMVPRTSRIPSQIGSSSQIVSQDCLFHVIGETAFEVGQMHDILTAQEEKRFRGLDVNKMYESGAYPLDSEGMVVSGALMYPDLVGDEGYNWGQIRVSRSRGTDNINEPPIFYSTIRTTLEVDLP